MNCKKHNRYNCYSLECLNENIGQLGINSNGEPTLNIGSGMTMSLTDGSLGLGSYGGYSIDTN